MAELTPLQKALAQAAQLGPVAAIPGVEEGIRRRREEATQREFQRRGQAEVNLNRAPTRANAARIEAERELLGAIFQTRDQLIELRKTGRPDHHKERQFIELLRGAVQEGVIDQGNAMTVAENAVSEAFHPFNPGFFAKSPKMFFDALSTQLTFAEGSEGALGAAKGEDIGMALASRLPAGNLLFRTGRAAARPFLAGGGAAAGYALEREQRDIPTTTAGAVLEGVASGLIPGLQAVREIGQDTAQAALRHTRGGQVLRENRAVHELFEDAKKIFQPPGKEFVNEAYQKVYNSGLVIPSKGGANPVSLYLRDLDPAVIRAIRAKLRAAPHPRNLKLSKTEKASFYNALLDNFLDDAPKNARIGTLDTWRQAVSRAAHRTEDTGIGDVLNDLRTMIDRHIDETLEAPDTIRRFTGEMEYIPPGGGRAARPGELPPPPGVPGGRDQRWQPGRGVYYHDPGVGQQLPQGPSSALGPRDTRWQPGSPLHFYDPDVARQLGQPEAHRFPAGEPFNRQWQYGEAPPHVQGDIFPDPSVGRQLPPGSGSGAPPRSRRPGAGRGAADAAPPRMSHDEAIALLKDAREGHFLQTSTDRLVDLLSMSSVTRSSRKVRKGGFMEVNFGKLRDLLRLNDDSIAGAARLPGSNLAAEVSDRLDRVEGARQGLIELVERLENKYIPRFRIEWSGSQSIIDSPRNLLAHAVLSRPGRRLLEQAIIEGRGVVPSSTLTRIANISRRALAGTPSGVSDSALALGNAIQAKLREAQPDDEF